MTYHATVLLRSLRESDLPALMALKEAAGWNQTVEDWQRVLRLAPEGCFGIEEAGRLAASATVVSYGADLAWIGMVLTLPEFRGRGLARRLMERVIEIADKRPMRLDASDMGRPLYASMGFVAECRVERWRREPGAIGPARPVEPLRYDPDLDLAVFGADRTALVRDLAQVGGASAGGGYALVRPGSDAGFFGPCVAEHDDDAATLLRWFVSTHWNAPCVLDLFPTHPMAVVAAELGFQPFRRLTRMVRQPVSPVEPDPRMYSIAGFEWG